MMNGFRNALTALTCRESNRLLNTAVSTIQADNAAFYIHYWGSSLSHNTNMRHHHSFFEACFVVDGSGVYREDEAEYPLRAGTLFLSRTHRWHQIVSEPDMALLWVGFELDETQSSPEMTALFRRLASTETFLAESAWNTPAALCWQALWLQAEQSPSLLRLIAPDLAKSLLLSLPALFAADLPDEGGAAEHDGGRHLFRQASLYIRDNLSRPLRLEEVAEYLHISGRQLTRIFRSHSGLSFGDYVTSERLKKAHYLLKNTDLTTHAIAEQVGFGSVHYFTKVFAAKRGLPPAAYRKQLRSPL